MRNIFMGVLAAVTLLVTGVVAQHDEHHPDQATPPDKAAAMPVGQTTGQMNQMMPMMAAHAEAAKLADQLVAGFAAIENEKDPTALKEELAEHGKLLRELQANLKKQSEMMEHMHGMMMGGAMQAGDKKQ